jgi:hypothetical protein
MAERKGVPALGWWLMLVGSLRLASVWFGFFNIWALRVAVFSQADSACPPFPPPLPVSEVMDQLLLCGVLSVWRSIFRELAIQVENLGLSSDPNAGVWLCRIYICA